MFNRDHKKIQPIIKEKVHILTLDNRWHELFSKDKSKSMTLIEKKLNNLIKKQGQYTNEHKEYSLLKKKVMADIVSNMSENIDDKYSSNMDKNKRYINEINKKLEKIEEELTRLPQMIDRANAKLLDVSMSVCYNRMMKHKNVLDGMDDRIEQLRNELKELIGEKTERKEEYEQLYTYMHDLVGSDVMEEFDSLYLGGSDND